ncbi:MAG: M1 family metallopeptidase [Gulosibacter sp.]|uniref:M1 family metallopeptidase n=1 Tax=Gulosibacter sp. TaxID=2817531 RepID=UPI003F910BC2
MTFKLPILDTRPNAYMTESGDTRYAVAQYRLELDYTPRTNRLEGTATLRIRVLEDTKSLRVDLIGLKASKVRVDGWLHRQVTHSRRHLQIKFDRILLVGEELDLAIEYAGRPAPTRSKWGKIGWEELDTGALVASQPTGAPTWFPCNDRVDDRATYEALFTCDREFFVAMTGAQGPVTSRGGKRTWTFSSSVPTATYLVALHVGEYREYSLGDGRILTPASQWPRVRTAFAPIPRMKDVFEDWFGEYPQEDLTTVVTAEELEIPLEAQGMATFGINHCAPKEQRLLAHELAHQWFGNSVDIRRWSDIWLNEGFACFAEWVWSEASGGPSIEVCANQHYAELARKSKDLLLIDPGEHDLFDDRVYKRGALLLETLRRMLGNESFRVLMRRWAVEYKHQLVTSEDFIALVEEVGGITGQDDVWKKWLYDRALPPLIAPATP